MRKGSTAIEYIIKFTLGLFVLAVVGYIIFLGVRTFLGSTEDSISGIGKTCQEMANNLGASYEMVSPGTCPVKEKNIILAKNTKDQAETGLECCLNTEKKEGQPTFTCQDVANQASSIAPGFTYETYGVDSSTECSTKASETGYTGKNSFFSDIAYNSKKCCVVQRSK